MRGHATPSRLPQETSGFRTIGGQNASPVKGLERLAVPLKPSGWIMSLRSSRDFLSIGGEVVTRPPPVGAPPSPYGATSPCFAQGGPRLQTLRPVAFAEGRS
jgi:hypothetical protein